MNDDIDDQYRRASAAESGEPAETTRQRILAHAALRAAQRSAAGTPVARGFAPPRGAPRWRRPALFGTLAAATVAGLMVIPQLLRPDTSPQVARQCETTRPVLQAPQPVATSPEAPATPAADASRQRARVTAATPAPRYASQPAAPAPAPAPLLSAAPARAEAGAAAAAMTRSVAAADTQPAVPTDIDARDGAGRTALLKAVLRGDATTVASLLARGANPNLADSGGLSPLQAAIEGHEPAIAAALRQAGAH